MWTARSLETAWLAVLMMALGTGCRMQGGDGGGSGAPDPAPAKEEQRVTLVHPPSGEIPAIVQGEEERATSAGRRLVVYVGATWCEPCQRFHHALENGELDGALPKLTLIEFDADRDSHRLRSAGYNSRFIPLFVLPNPDGTASDKRVEGGIKGDGAVSFVTGKLKELLARN
jgi:thiol-disulfide isomerase/thioredoxin